MRSLGTVIVTVGLAVFVAAATALGAGGTATPARAAAEPTGLEIMEHVNRDHKASDEKASAEMIIQGKGRTPRKRKVTMWFANVEGGDDDKLLVRFVAPADIKGTGLLTIERGEDEDQWLFLPALRKTRRIASGSKSERFAGTDFTYEDMRTEELSQNAYKLLRSEELLGQACWVVEAQPSSEKRKKESAYARRVIWVRKDHYLPIRVEFWDDRDRKVKRLDNGDWREVEGKWRFHKAIMEDFVRGSQTLMRYSERDIAPGLEDRLFTKGELERG